MVFPRFVEKKYFVAYRLPGMISYRVKNDTECINKCVASKIVNKFVEKSVFHQSKSK